MIPKSQESDNSIKCYSCLNLRGTFLADTLYTHNILKQQKMQITKYQIITTLLENNNTFKTFGNMHCDKHTQDYIVKRKDRFCLTLFLILLHFSRLATMCPFEIYLIVHILKRFLQVLLQLKRILIDFAKYLLSKQTSVRMHPIFGKLLATFLNFMISLHKRLQRKHLIRFTNGN